MGAFLASLFSEFGARRERMRAAFGDRTTSLIEFMFLGGVVMGLIAVWLGEPRGAAPLVALVAGYILLDVSRQRALSGGADEAVTRKRQDRLAFALFAALAALGAAFCVYAMRKQENWFTPPPPNEKYDVDITSPS